MVVSNNQNFWIPLQLSDASIDDTIDVLAIIFVHDLRVWIWFRSGTLKDTPKIHI